MKWGSEQHLLPLFHLENLENLENVERVPCSRRLDFADRRGRYFRALGPSRGGFGSRGRLCGGLRASKLEEIIGF